MLVVNACVNRHIVYGPRVIGDRADERVGNVYSTGLVFLRWTALKRAFF